MELRKKNAVCTEHLSLEAEGEYILEGTEVARHFWGFYTVKEIEWILEDMKKVQAAQPLDKPSNA